MARPLRIEFSGAVYHLTSRGNARQAIFIDDEDRGRFLDLLSIVVERFKWLCHAYCLMENHYHLLIETPNANLSKGMRELNGVYTQGFNQRYRRVGHLFQGRYRAIIVEKDNHLYRKLSEDLKKSDLNWRDKRQRTLNPWENHFKWCNKLKLKIKFLLILGFQKFSLQSDDP